MATYYELPNNNEASWERIKNALADTPRTYNELNALLIRLGHMELSATLDADQMERDEPEVQLRTLNTLRSITNNDSLLATFELVRRHAL